ncbi:hypothetical protein QBC32DRAFT_222289 [Pseudoneurospora amorphoporcata]|uniref:Uncharacterized protein n=1 Tax=Pseudoneurospora amorphoporcata TaxID=241081 RepID=A0AAN6SCA1_9PEZI|nr:hypothetical protein QBC32DRAFT_222289 [Pseudoneurospora amorphoporcata]
MGHRSKFPFSIPGRKAKPMPPPPLPPPPPSGAPLTKAQKILGTGEINIDSPWEIRASPAINNAPVSSAAHHNERDVGQRRTHHIEASASHERRWDDEPEAAPRNTGWQHNDGPEIINYAVANTSHQQRRQSSSTTASYYDQQQHQLQRQQTQNSAMSKSQLPSKAQQLLDFDNGVQETTPEVRMKKKKPSMLDISSRLLKSKSSKQLKPDLVDYSAHVLGADMITNSPVMPTAPDMSQQPMKRRTERTEYERYQQESYANSAGQEMYEAPNLNEGPAPDEEVSSFPAPPLNPSARTVSLSLFPPTSSGRPVQTPKQPEGPPSSVLTPSSLASPLADSESISSRHTRTSKASKRTDRSMTELDLQMNSVLSLSSDSEEDSYESSTQKSLAVPIGLGEQGPLSPASTLSTTSQPSPSTADYGRASKSAKRLQQYGTQTQFLPIPEGAAAADVSRRSARGTSQKTSSSKKQASSLLYQTSRLSIGSTSTSQTAMHGKPSHARNSMASHNSGNATPPLSPTSVDAEFYLQNRSSEAFGAYAPDNRSVYSGRSLGSDGFGGAGRRGSTTSSIQDNASGRFMAVTRQEEMLLAALRQKRARMREDILAEYGDNTRDGSDLDPRLDPQDARHIMMSESTTSSSRVSRQSSASTMRLMEANALNARPHGHQRPQIRISTGSVDKRSDRTLSESSGQILVMMDRPLRQSSGGCGDESEPSPDLDGFMHFDDGAGGEMLTRGAFGGPYESGDYRRNSRSSLGGHSTSESYKAQRTPSSRSKASSRSDRVSDHVSPKTFGHLAREAERRNRIVEAPEEDDMEDDGIPRPDSPISPGDFPVPVSMLKKNVRLSAVGHY